MRKEYEDVAKDVSARLPYGVFVQTINGAFRVVGIEYLFTLYNQEPSVKVCTKDGIEIYSISEVIPCLRSLSSMSNEEIGVYNDKTEFERIEFCLMNHYDIRGLIDNGNAVCVTIANNPYIDNKQNA